MTYAAIRSRTANAEELIEALAERAIIHLDARYMAGELTEYDYDYEMALIDKWCHQLQYEYDALS